MKKQIVLWSVLPASVFAAFVAVAADAPSKPAVEGFERTGETVTCLPLRPIDGVKALSETLFLFEAGGRTYANDVSGSCNGADRPWTYLQYKVSGGTLCKGEIIHVVDQGGDFLRGSCALGDFELLKEVKAEEPAKQ